MINLELLLQTLDQKARAGECPETPNEVCSLCPDRFPTTTLDQGGKRAMVCNNLWSPHHQEYINDYPEEKTV